MLSIGPPSSSNAVERDRARCRERYARIRQATPAWLTDEQRAETEAMYAKARELTKHTGIAHQVDHIVPIRGRNDSGSWVVSGLHVPWNLRVITRAANLRKTNIYAAA